MILACMVTSSGDKYGNSRGCVWIQPKGSKSSKYSWEGSDSGIVTFWWVPVCGTNTQQTISFTSGSSRLTFPYNKPLICVRKSPMQMKRFNTFLGMMYVYLTGMGAQKEVSDVC